MGISHGSRVYVLRSADEDYGGQVGEVVGFIYTGAYVASKPVVRFQDGEALAFPERYLLELPEPKTKH